MISVKNLTSRSSEPKFFEKVAKKVLKGENRLKQGLIIVLVGSEKIRRINKQFRSKDRPTDVLSFSGTEPGKEKFILPEEARQEKILGEILICPEIAERNAKKLNIPQEKELARVLIHGILHLLGYEHEKSKSDREEMERRQEYYLSCITNL